MVRDGSLGEGPLEVGPGTDPLGQAATYLVTPEMGEQSGSNLFHSFASFGIGVDETATFTGPDPIDGPQSVDNVISRVTGPDESQIDGTLRSTIPGADLWLINPSGVVFGDGAQLDVPGSFHASTGDYLGFGEGGLERFYGDPSRPSVLSTAPPGAFGFLGEGPAAAISVTGATLATVRAGDGLELAGGDVTLTRATLAAPGGAISIRGGEIVVEQGSRVLAENTGESPAGAITVIGSESVIVDASLLSASTSGEGSAGTIRLEGGEITLRNGPGLANAYAPSDPLNLPHRVTVGASVETTGSGNAGRLEIAADSLTVTAGAGLSAQTVGPDGEFASGDGGAIEIRAGSVLVSDLGFATVESWRSTGDAGSIDVHADTLTIDATRADGKGSYPTTLTASSLTRRFVLAGGVLALGPAYDPEDRALGEPGTIEIEARSLHLLNGGSIESSCFDCLTRAGTVRVVVDEMIAEGQTRSGSLRLNSFIGTSTVGSAARGEGGLIDVTAGSLVLRTGGLVSDTGLGAANAGGLVRVCADRVELLDRGGIGVNSFQGATGDAGSVEIHANSVLISRSWDPFNMSGIFASAFGPTGDAGAIDIEAGSLVIAPGGIIAAEAGAGSSGTAGTVTVRAESVRIGPDPDAAPAGLVLQPAFITVSSFGTGNGGTIEVEASRSILLTFEGGLRLSVAANRLRNQLGLPSLLVGIFSATVGGGDGGSIQLQAPDISVTHGAIVASSTLGGGTAGTIRLDGERLRVANGGAVDSSSLPFPGPPFTPSGDAGTVTLVATESIEVLGSDPMFGVSRVSSLSMGSGAAGALLLHAPRIVIDGGAVATTAVRSGDGQEGTQGGAITLEAEQLLVTNGGQVDASTFIAGDGGSIEVTAGESIVVLGEESSIASRTGGSGAGGSVTLRAPTIEIADGGEVSAKSEQGFGGMGRIFAKAIEDRLIGLPPASATGNAGSVTLTDANEVRLFGGTIATNAEAADGGDVKILAKQLVHLDAGVITATVTGGDGGNVTIDPEVVILQNRSRIVASAATTGSGGNIQITADNYFAFPGSVVDASSELGIDGIVEVSTPDVDLAGTLTALPASYLDAASLMRERCAARRSGERAGSFAVRGNGGIPAEPDGWLPASVSFEAAPGGSATSDLPAGPGGAPLFALGACP